MLPVRLFVQAGPLLRQYVSGCFQSVYLALSSPTQVASFMPAVHLSSSCVVSFWMSSYAFPFEESAYFLGSVLGAARSSVGQLDCAKHEKGKALRQGSFTTPTKTYSGDPALLF